MAHLHPKESARDKSVIHWIFLVLVGIAIALAILTVCLLGGVWLRHHHHVLHPKSIEIAGMLGSTAGFVSSIFAGSSLLFVAYSLRNQDSQRRDDGLRESFLDTLQMLYRTIPEDNPVRIKKSLITLGDLEREVGWLSQDGTTDEVKFWKTVGFAARQEFGSPSMDQQRAWLVVLQKLFDKASIGEQGFLRSIIPAYFPLDYTRVILCDAFAAQHVATVRAMKELDLLEAALSGHLSLLLAFWRT
jgi:hypothetical protein